MFARQRRGRALVRVFNPTLREYGYSSPHTVIEMVNDDMPFLVDSIGLALTRRGLTLHFLAHPVFAVTRDKAGVLRSRRRARRGGRQTSAARIVPAHRSRPHRRRGGAAVPVRGNRAQHARRAGRVRGLGQDARRRAAHGGRLDSLSSRFDPRDVSEAQALLAWMENRHFTFLGYKEYRLRSRKGLDALEAVDIDRPWASCAGATSVRRTPAEAYPPTFAARAARAIWRW